MKYHSNGILKAIENFYFRDVHEKVFPGTASDRYAGWVGQIYTRELYEGKISRRRKKVGSESLVEEVLPIESVREYFDHFRVLELDFTFYGLLLDSEGKPTRIYHTLQKYGNYLNERGQLFVKVPQVIFAQKLMRGGKFVENPDYLDPASFVKMFYDPITRMFDGSIRGFIFEQEYQRKSERLSVEKLAEELDRFFGQVPDDDRYHVELRTGDYLRDPLFRVLEKHGVGQVLSHWTWLPRLRRQLETSGERFFNAGNNCVIRLMTPRGMKYEDAYIKAHPFDRLVEGMLHRDMIDDTVEIMRKAIREGQDVNVIINNRAGGNAPIIAQMILKKFISHE